MSGGRAQAGDRREASLGCTPQERQGLGASGRKEHQALSGREGRAAHRVQLTSPLESDGRCEAGGRHAECRVSGGGRQGPSALHSLLPALSCFLTCTGKPRLDGLFTGGVSAERASSGGSRKYQFCLLLSTATLRPPKQQAGQLVSCGFHGLNDVSPAWYLFSIIPPPLTENKPIWRTCASCLSR